MREWIFYVLFESLYDLLMSARYLMLLLYDLLILTNACLDLTIDDALFC